MFECSSCIVMAHPLTGDDDFCTELLSLEHDFQQQGFAEGLAIGERLGFLEGYSLGCNKGSEIGAELGFCLGCVRVWRSILQHAGSEVYSQRYAIVCVCVYWRAPPCSRSHGE